VECVTTEVWQRWSNEDSSLLSAARIRMSIQSAATVQCSDGQTALCRCSGMKQCCKMLGFDLVCALHVLHACMSAVDVSVSSQWTVATSGSPAGPLVLSIAG